jgi:hypothetical protein
MVLLMGQVAAEGVNFFYNENNTPEAIWTLVVEEPGAQGTVFKTFIPYVAMRKRRKPLWKRSRRDRRCSSKVGSNSAH